MINRFPCALLGSICFPGMLPLGKPLKCEHLLVLVFCKAIPTRKKAYSNGALPRQANKVKLYLTAQMNLPPTPLMVYNTQSAFALTGSLKNSYEWLLWVTLDLWKPGGAGKSKQLVPAAETDMPRASWVGDARLGTNEDEFTVLCTWKHFILLPP